MCIETENMFIDLLVVGDYVFFDIYQYYFLLVNGDQYFSTCLPLILV